METNNIAAATKHKGVGGWLLLFCIGLIIISPLLNIFSITSGYQEVSPYFEVYPRILPIVIITSVLGIVLSCFSIYAGIVLWKIRPNAVKIAKNYLLTMLGYSILSAFLPFMAGLPAEANQAMLTTVAADIFRTVIYTAVWYSYLNRSIRVKQTYGAIIPQK